MDLKKLKIIVGNLYYYIHIRVRFLAFLGGWWVIDGTLSTRECLQASAGQAGGNEVAGAHIVGLQARSTHKALATTAPTLPRDGSHDNTPLLFWECCHGNIEILYRSRGFLTRLVLLKCFIITTWIRKVSR